jgi:hypothetical protein
MSADSASNNGIGLGGLLFVVFLVLKLTNVIAWSWWWVTAPLWGPLALALILFAIVGFGALISR